MKIMPILMDPGYRRREGEPRYGVNFDQLSDERAIENHGQSLEMLASRGGLSWSEMHAVITRRELRYRVEESVARTALLPIALILGDV